MDWQDSASEKSIGDFERKGNGLLVRGLARETCLEWVEDAAFQVIMDL